jgi:hypothetical protein
MRFQFIRFSAKFPDITPFPQHLKGLNCDSDTGMIPVKKYWPRIPRICTNSDKRAPPFAFVQIRGIRGKGLLIAAPCDWSSYLA